MTPYLYKHRAKELIHLIQTDYGIHLTDKTHHDIYSNMHHAVIEEDDRARSGEEYWKQEYQDLKRKGYPLKWNELRLKLARMKTEEADDVLDLMCMLDDGVSIR